MNICMKVLAISDNVLPPLENQDNLRRQYSDTDLIISCGDMPAPYLDLISSTLSLPLFFVRGNHDARYEPGYPGGDDLHLKLITYQGVSFAGLEGCLNYNDEPVQYTELAMFIMVLKLAPIMVLRRLRFGNGIDVMVTHAPPRGIHDLKDRAHRGFRSFRLMLNLYRPRYMLHGHVDTWDNRRPTVTKSGATEVININPVKVLTFERRLPGGL